MLSKTLLHRDLCKILIGSLALSTILILSNTASFAQSRVGTIADGLGEVKLGRGERQSTVEPGAAIFPADVIQTARPGFAEMIFEAGWSHDLAAGSSAIITWDPENTILVARGAVWSVSHSDKPFTVVSGVAIAEAPGTAFYFIVEANGATTVFVRQGVVQFSNRAGASVSVAAGLASRVTADGGPPSPPAPPPNAVQQAAITFSTMVATSTSPTSTFPMQDFRALSAKRKLAQQTAQQTPASRNGPNGHGKGE